MGILQDRKLLITGVLTEASLAFGVAKLAQAEGAEIVLTGAGRALSLTKRTARKLDRSCEVLPLDVTNEEEIAGAVQWVNDQWGHLDGMLHAIGYAPPACLGSGVLQAGWQDVSVALQVSAYSLKALAQPFADLLAKGSFPSVVGLDFDASVAWPMYDWMGVAKAALESLARYLARDLGSSKVRVNLVAAGPIRTMAAKSIPGFSRFEDVFAERAPLGWEITNPEPVAKACVALLSDWFPMTTGEIIHVDGGYHAIGA